MATNTKGMKNQQAQASTNAVLTTTDNKTSQIKSDKEKILSSHSGTTVTADTVKTISKKMQR